MGTFQVTIDVGDPAGARYVPVEALVDTGASHTLVPRTVLDDLGLEPEEWWPFRLADESEVEYEVSDAEVRIDGQTRYTIVIFGDLGATPLPGAYTLEGCRLAADPVGRRLIPVPGLLKRSATHDHP